MRSRIRPIAWLGSRVQSSLKPACIFWLQTRAPLVEANPSFFPDSVTPVASQPEVLFFLGRDQGRSVGAGLRSHGEVLPLPPRACRGPWGDAGAPAPHLHFWGVCKGGKQGEIPSGKQPEERGQAGC